MIKIDMDETQIDFSVLLTQALNGEDIIIEKNGLPLARLVPYEEKNTKRIGGQLQGILTISPDFDAPLPPEYINLFDK